MEFSQLRPSRSLLLRVCFAGLAFLGSGIPLAVRADYIHQTQAAREGTILELHVGEQKIEALLEIDADDRSLFQGLLQPGAPITSEAFSLLDSSTGQPLTGTVEEVETRRRTIRYDPKAPVAVDLRGVPLTLPQVSPLVTFVRVSFPLRNRPPGLTLRPPLEKGQERAATNIGFIVFHEGLPISNYWYLSQPETLELNWADPWRSRFRNPNLKRAHASSLTSWVTVEPFEVRHEVVVRLLDLAPLLGIPLQGNQPLGAAQRDQILSRARTFFATRPRTLLNGSVRRGEVTDVNFLTVDAKGIFQLQPREFDHRPYSTLLGVSLSFPTERMARTVEVRWDVFSERIPSIAAQATDAAGPFPYVLTPEQPNLVWENVLKHQPDSRIEPVRLGSGAAMWFLAAALAVAAATVLVGLAIRRGRLRHEAVGPPQAWALLLAGPSLAGLLLVLALLQAPVQGGWLMGEEQAARLIEQLLANVYRAMEFRQEDRAYDRLALSLRNEILSDVYLQQRRSQRSAVDGGAVSRVQQVQVDRIRRVGWPGWGAPPRYEVAWTASGTVSHWGHTHQRQNRYAAQIDLIPSRDVWKIADLTMLEETRLP
ncbi:MAG: hypothetical protein VKJ66_01670 [Synechococcus sp.]|nr:hypothetical protein [Synechococcus sp.]